MSHRYELQVLKERKDGYTEMFQKFQSNSLKECEDHWNQNFKNRKTKSGKFWYWLVDTDCSPPKFLNIHFTE